MWNGDERNEVMRMTHRGTAGLAILLLALKCLAPLPARAAEACSPEAQSLLVPDNLPELTGDAKIRQAQACLNSRGCYRDRAAKNIDGIVGRQTNEALQRSRDQACTAAPLPRPEPEPERKPEPAPASKAAEDDFVRCGDGNQAVSWRLTQEDLDILQSRIPLTEQIQNGLPVLLDTDFPSTDLFEYALAYAVRSSTSPARNLGTDADLNRDIGQTLATDIKPYRKTVLEIACKASTDANSGPDWQPRWSAPMYNALAQPVYGFWPHGAAKSDKGKFAADEIDFGLVNRIGWLGISFTDRGILTMPANFQATATKQIELARRFTTAVNLVIFRRMKKEDWLNLVTGSPDALAETLTQNVADLVGTRRNGFLDRLQYWLFPTELTLPTTAWDGVTLDFDGYPYDDPRSVKFLLDLITKMRRKFNGVEHHRSAALWRLISQQPDRLDISLVVPYSVFVPSAGTGADKPIGADDTILQLAQLVPKTQGSGLAEETSPDDIADQFIVFLPELTSSRKKELRQAIESAFNRTDETRKILYDNKNLSLAMWRYQMLRRITYILLPQRWDFGDGFYTNPGKQFYDDMLYARDNFAAAGFWPLVGKKSEDTDLPADIRGIFGGDEYDLIQNAAPRTWSAAGISIANRFSFYRREMFFFTEITAFISLIYYALCSYIAEYNNFYQKNKIKFKIIMIFNFLFLMCTLWIFPKLHSLALKALIFLIFSFLFAVAVRQWFVRRVETDLP